MTVVIDGFDDLGTVTVVIEKGILFDDLGQYR